MKTGQQQVVIIFFGLIFILILYNFPTNVVGDDDQTINTPPKENSVEKALKLVNSSNPMEGVFMLRKILEEDPKNKEVLFNLGVLSIQSKQFQNAIERFNQLLIIDSLDKRAYLQLGIANFELEKKKEATFFFNKIKDSKDASLIEELNKYLNK